MCLKGWELQQSADVWAMEFEAEECDAQARTLYKKNFPKVMLARDFGSYDFASKEILISGKCPEKQEDLKWLLKTCDKYMAKHTAKIVLALASPRPPKELEGSGWTSGSHEASWSVFSSFEASTFVTLYCKGNGCDAATGNKLAKGLAAEMENCLGPDRRKVGTSRCGNPCWICLRQQPMQSEPQQSHGSCKSKPLLPS